MAAQNEGTGTGKVGAQHRLFVRNCKLCGCPLGFATTAEGKVIPLDLRTPVYAVTGKDDKQCVRTDLSFPTHYSTCPKASEFTKK